MTGSWDEQMKALRFAMLEKIGGSGDEDTDRQFWVSMVWDEARGRGEKKLSALVVLSMMGLESDFCSRHAAAAKQGGDRRLRETSPLAGGPMGTSAAHVPPVASAYLAADDDVTGRSECGGAFDPSTQASVRLSRGTDLTGVGLGNRRFRSARRTLLVGSGDDVSEGALLVDCPDASRGKSGSRCRCK